MPGPEICPKQPERKKTCEGRGGTRDDRDKKMGH